MNKNLNSMIQQLATILVLVLNLVSAAEYPVNDVVEKNGRINVYQHVSLFTERNATFGKEYDERVDFNKGVTFRFEPFTLALGEAVRISVVSPEATKDLPVLFVVKQQKSVLSWQVPLLPLKRFEYYNVTRSLCPPNDEYNTTQYLIIDVTTMSFTSTAFTLKAVIENIQISEGTYNLTQVTPSKPRFLYYEFPEDIDSVVITVESQESYCSVLSVQDTSCPIYDLLGNVEFVGLRQTVSRRGAITVQKSKYSSFFIVLVVKPSDYDCSMAEKLIPPVPINHTIEGYDFEFNIQDLARIKTFNITVQQAISRNQFIAATVGAFGLYFLFYLVAFVLVCVYHCRGSRVEDEESHSEERTGLLGNDDIVIRNYASISPIEDAAEPSMFSATSGLRSRDVPNPVSGGGDLGQGQGRMDSSSSSEVSLDDDDETGNDADMLEDANSHKDIRRTKRSVCVADLSRKPAKVLNKKYNLYIWNLITLAIFYALPVIQLVITYQTVVNKTGDEDLCYYNFYCARGLGVLSSFNNVFSNIGYVMLGILFIILVSRRDLLHRRQILEAQNRIQIQEYGIPQHYGVFYAMGIALVMEGVLSGCYHVCPSYNNFQFDTAFMYMIGWLCMLKIYQTRHPDINAHAHTAYCAIAVVVFIGVIGITQISKTYWIVFITAYVLCSLGLTIHVYYMGRWKLDIYVFKRIYIRIRTEKLHFFVPLYFGRFILLVLGNVVNISFAIYGLITQPRDFASYLLAIVIINLIMYFAFYIIMKLLYREKILPQPMFYIIGAAICWGFALYFFMIRLTSWQLSPAMSRESNENCLLLNFFDRHDIWHFLSSISLFLSFMVLLTLEDDLVEVPRDKISVF